MYDAFFKNLHYFKFNENILNFNMKHYTLEELPEHFYNKSIIDCYNHEETNLLIIAFIYKIYQELEITWDSGQGFDGSRKYIDKVAYVEYYDERLDEFRRITIKNFRFYDDDEICDEDLTKITNLYELMYA
jgi:hypothetical protein